MTSEVNVIDLDGNVRKHSTMIQGRTNFGVCLIGDFLYVVGGQSQNGNLLSSCERLNLVTKEWRSLAECEVPLKGCEICTDTEDLIWRFGGIDQSLNNVLTVGIYSTKLNSWMVKKISNIPR